MIERRSNRKLQGFNRILDAQLLFHRLKHAQTPYSVASVGLALTFLVIFVADIWVGHPHIQRGVVVFWIVCFSAFVVLPLALGNRYPQWAGLVVVGFIGLCSAYFMLLSVHGPAIINALLELPMTALYLGWFWRAALGRIALGVNILLMILALSLRDSPPPVTFSVLVAMGYATFIAGFCLESAVFVRRRVERRELTDSLTGALNRFGLAESSKRLVELSARRRADLTVVAIDFDDFKGVNDSGGHAAGDAALVSVVKLWQRHLEAGELVARTGGDEFVLILRSNLDEAAVRMARMRDESDYAWSWGPTAFTPGDSLDAMLTRADAALYRAKGAPLAYDLDSSDDAKC